MTTPPRKLKLVHATPPEPLLSWREWLGVALSAFLIVAALTAFIAYADPKPPAEPDTDILRIAEVIGAPGSRVEVPIYLSSTRDIGAVRVSFYDYDAHGATFGGAVLGDDVPSTWWFAVHDSMPEYPGAVLVNTIGSGLDFIQGQDLEVFRLIYDLGPCGSASALEIATDSQLTHLSTIQLQTVVDSCAGFTCCCHATLGFDGGLAMSDCTVGTVPRTWSQVRSLYR
jgi:hypothetical protein